jgi:hypothetical protein
VSPSSPRLLQISRESESRALAPGNNRVFQHNPPGAAVRSRLPRA